MNKNISIFAAALLLGVLATGCAGPEKKLGRGLANSYEIVRGGEMRRSLEHQALFGATPTGYTTGMVRGFNRTLARTGLGLWEIVTSPFPPYDPVATSYLAPNPVYPDSYKPRLIESTTLATDAAIGFSGGDISPYFPASRFRIFDN